MKRFRFQLEPVLDFKQQALDALMVELGAAQEMVRRQREACENAYRRIEEYDEECARKKEEGITVLELLECQTCRQVLERQARREDEELRKLQAEEEAKRLQVVEARKETFSLEKLKDLRRKEYDAEAAKAEERTLDDLTAAKRAMGNFI